RDSRAFGEAGLALTDSGRGRIARRLVGATERGQRADRLRASVPSGLLAARAFAAFRLLAGPFLRGFLRVPDFALHEHQGTGDRGPRRPHERVGEFAARSGHFFHTAGELLQKPHGPPRCIGGYEPVGDHAASLSMATGNDSAKRLQSTSETVNDARR